MFDVAIIEASLAGPSAASQPGRSVSLIDGGCLRNRSSLATRLAVALSVGPTGPVVRIGPMQQTDKHVNFGAGHLASPMSNITFAVGADAAVNTGCCQSLFFPDFIPPLEKEAA